ncbi:hypothetical protein BB560_001220 [Smittium megazygosporum]|uniref:Uncharacterized protein n=1 Tax=Smittium megazygosporum TaxID=133381 RepID=A0A2T9ZI42_9FUNG|nr:hypothetical protein BB560_001220 [Smittium megazygosporum]
MMFEPSSNLPDKKQQLQGVIRTPKKNASNSNHPYSRSEIKPKNQGFLGSVKSLFTKFLGEHPQDQKKNPSHLSSKKSVPVLNTQESSDFSRPENRLGSTSYYQLPKLQNMTPLNPGKWDSTSNISYYTSPQMGRIDTNSTEQTNNMNTSCGGPFDPSPGHNGNAEASLSHKGDTRSFELNISSSSGDNTSLPHFRFDNIIDFGMSYRYRTIYNKPQNTSSKPRPLNNQPPTTSLSSSEALKEKNYSKIKTQNQFPISNNGINSNYTKNENLASNRVVSSEALPSTMSPAKRLEQSHAFKILERFNRPERSVYYSSHNRSPYQSALSPNPQLYDPQLTPTHATESIRKREYTNEFDINPMFQKRQKRNQPLSFGTRLNYNQSYFNQNTPNQTSSILKKSQPTLNQRAPVNSNNPTISWKFSARFDSDDDSAFPTQSTHSNAPSSTAKKTITTLSGQKPINTSYPMIPTTPLNISQFGKKESAVKSFFQSKESKQPAETISSVISVNAFSNFVGNEDKKEQSVSLFSEKAKAPESTISNIPNPPSGPLFGTSNSTSISKLADTSSQPSVFNAPSPQPLFSTPKPAVSPENVTQTNTDFNKVSLDISEKVHEPVKVPEFQPPKTSSISQINENTVYSEPLNVKPKVVGPKFTFDLPEPDALELQKQKLSRPSIPSLSSKSSKENFVFVLPTPPVSDNSKNSVSPTGLDLGNQSQKPLSIGQPHTQTFSFGEKVSSFTKPAESGVSAFQKPLESTITDSNKQTQPLLSQPESISNQNGNKLSISFGSNLLKSNVSTPSLCSNPTNVSESPKSQPNPFAAKSLFTISNKESSNSENTQKDSASTQPTLNTSDKPKFSFGFGSTSETDGNKNNNLFGNTDEKPSSGIASTTFGSGPSMFGASQTQPEQDAKLFGKIAPNTANGDESKKTEQIKPVFNFSNSIGTSTNQTDKNTNKLQSLSSPNIVGSASSNQLPAFNTGSQNSSQIFGSTFSSAVKLAENKLPNNSMFGNLSNANKPEQKTQFVFGNTQPQQTNTNLDSTNTNQPTTFKFNASGFPSTKLGNEAPDPLKQEKTLSSSFSDGLKSSSKPFGDLGLGSNKQNTSFQLNQPRRVDSESFASNNTPNFDQKRVQSLAQPNIQAHQTGVSFNFQPTTQTQGPFEFKFGPTNTPQTSNTNISTISTTSNSNNNSSSNFNTFGQPSSFANQQGLPQSFGSANQNLPGSIQQGFGTQMGGFNPLPTNTGQTQPQMNQPFSFTANQPPIGMNSQPASFGNNQPSGAFSFGGGFGNQGDTAQQPNSGLFSIGSQNINNQNIQGRKIAKLRRKK